MSQRDALACVPEPSALRASVALLRRTREFRFVGGRRSRATARKPTHPLTSYQIAFERKPDERVVASVRKMFRREERRAERGIFDDEPGYIYCFHDLADAADVLKIGRTHRTPDERLSEWATQLAPDSKERAVVLLFAHKTSYNKLAERVIHEVLFCESMGKRLNVDGNKMEEFFRLDNALAASIFVRQTIAYVERRGADLVRRYARAAPLTATNRKRKF